MQCSAGARLPAALMGAILLLLAVTFASATRPASASGERPNVLVILTDDQRADTVTSEVMPKTRTRFEQQGTRFPEGYATTPLCCPSRSSIFSGRYVHNHGIRGNDIRQPPANVALPFDHDKTLQAYLHAAGYQTGIVGKFLNNWNLNQDPPRWDKWAIMNAGQGPVLAVNEWDDPLGLEGKLIGSLLDPLWSTSYVYDRALQFLVQAEAENDARPWFLHVAPTAPHAPFVPEPQYALAPVPEFQPSPASFQPPDRSNIGGKPPYVTAQALRSMNDRDVQLHEREQQLRMLKSVDDLVDGLFTTLETLGEERDTLAFFVSDNGFMWGEHWQTRKGKPYTDSIRVPFYVRWPNGPASIATNRYAANIDLAPTILEAAGASSDPAVPMDGVSLFSAGPSRQRLLTESWRFQDEGTEANIPTWASLRTPAYQYIETYDDSGRVTFREYYDLVNDPYQLTNLYGSNGDPADDPPTNPPVSILAAQLMADRGCVGSGCPPIVDAVPPRAVDIQAENGGGSAGRADPGDRLLYSFAKAIDPRSLIPDWDGTGSRDVSVNLIGDQPKVPNDNDSVSIAGVAAGALGTIDLGRSDYVSSSRTLPARLTMTPDMTTARITLGDGKVPPTQGGTGTMVWSPSVAARDLVGNPASTEAARELGSSDREF